MKLMINVLFCSFLLIALLSSSSVKANELPDTILVQWNDQHTLYVIANDRQELSNLHGADLVLDQLNDRLASITELVEDPYGPVTLTYVAGKVEPEIKVYTGPMRVKVQSLHEDGSVSLVKSASDKIILQLSESMKLVLFNTALADIPNWASMSVDTILSSLSKEMMEAKIKEQEHIYGIYRHTSEGKWELAFREKKLDFVELYAGGGLGLVRNILTPEFGVNIAVAFTDYNGIPRHRAALKYTMHYFFEKQPEGEYQMDINSFILGEYANNYSGDKKQEKWVAFGVGYLVQRSGDYFQGETMKVYIRYDHQSRIFFAPELYATRDFEVFFPGISVGVGI